MIGACKLAKIYYSIRGSLGGGGPSVHVARMASALSKLGHQVIYDKANRSDVAVCIINVGNLLKKINQDKTKVILRVDGIYNSLYNKKFNRAVRPDMIALHEDLKKNIPKVDNVVYQSKWSFDCIQDEIVKYNGNSSIIHNGCDTDLFKPNPRVKDGFVNLISVGKMRDSYYMKTLIGTYNELKCRGNKVKLLLVGTMDAGCINEYKAYKSDPNIVHVGAFPNNKLTQAYNLGDIFLDVRQGCSSNNTVPEAQACGLPVLCASWGGDKEMIVDGKTGVVADSGFWDYDGKYISNLADGAQRIISDLDNFKLRSRKHAVKNLSLDIMVNKYRKVMNI